MLRLAPIEERPRPAAVLGRRGASAADADRVGALRRDRDDLRDPQVMLPISAEVVVVVEALAWPQAEIDQPHLGWVVGEQQAAEVGDALRLAVDDEPMQVRVAPAEGDLEEVV
jgi:hypothetical protein